MQRTGFATGAAILVALIILGLVMWNRQTNGTAGTPAASAGQMAEEPLELVTASGVKRLLVEVARTPEQQSKGLMFRTALADDRGMLFPYEQAREVTMWMRNTYIPLDMVFLYADGTVHRIEARTEPLSERIIRSDGNVSAVLELAGGAAERLGLRPGDKVRHAIFKAP
jgi:uncharacterized membrane protein (UPF0127 family)